jgi:hypothetical protein
LSAPERGAHPAPLHRNMLESGEACASLDGRSAHRRSAFASFALIVCSLRSLISGSDSETHEMQAKCGMKHDLS